MEFSIRYHFTISLAIAAVMLLVQNSAGQTSGLRVALVLDKERVQEHLPIAFKVHIRSMIAEEIEVLPYDESRLPSVILNVRFDSPLLLPPPPPTLIETGFPEVVIKPSGEVTIGGYLQDYLQHLRPGSYAIPYSLHWEYSLKGVPEGKHSVEAKSVLRFTVTNPDPTSLQEYVAERTKVLRESTDSASIRNAAEYLSHVDDPAVLPALMVLKDTGHEFEALQASKRLPGPAALEILAAIAGSSANPGIVRHALELTEEQKGELPESALRKLLGSANKWIQIEGLEYAEKTNNRRVLDAVNVMSKSTDADVSGVAERVRKKLNDNSPR